jgi:hypothetical protein
MTARSCLCVLAICTAICGEAQLVGLRNATAYVRVPAGTEPSLRIAYEPVWAWQRCFEHVYVQAPDGMLVTKHRIEAGDGTGELRVPLNRGAGDYRVSFSGQPFRVFRVTTEPPLPMVVQAAPVHAAFHARSAPIRLYFPVPEGTSSFMIGLKNQIAEPIEVIVTPPGQRAAVVVKGTAQWAGLKSRETVRRERDYFHNWDHDSRTFEKPRPGLWSLLLPTGSKTSVWLEGLPNGFATQPGDWFRPVLAPGHATIKVDAAGQAAGPVGLLGGSLPGGTVSKLADTRIRFLGLQAVCRYIGHAYREKTNDDDDPNHINWEGFNWGAEDVRSDYIASWGAVQTVIVSPAPWLGGRKLLERTDRDVAEYAEFIEALLIHYNVQRQTPIHYLSLLDEPNSAYSPKQVERLLKIVAPRVLNHPDKRVRVTRIMAPQSSMFLRSPTHVGGSGEAMATHLYKTCDPLIGGLAWDHWTSRNLLETWHYGDAIRRAARIQRQFDTDGQPEEPMAIFQTNFFGGGSISLHDTTTFYASLWWAAVVAQCMKTGRMNVLNWWMTFDDPHHNKGLCYAQERGGAVKPVGFAMKMLIRNLQADAVPSSSDDPEVIEIATRSADGQRLVLIVVNTAARAVALTADVDLPQQLRGTSCRLRVSRMVAGDEELQAVAEETRTTWNLLCLKRDLAGESIHVFDLSPAAP